MHLRRLTLLLAAALACGGCALEQAPAPKPTEGSGVVDRVVDGDTLALRDGSRVRLLQIDAPEVSKGECGHAIATGALRKLTPPGSTIKLANDPALDNVDRYGRLLRYVTNEQGRLVNVQLAGAGAASPYFYRGERGTHADTLLAVATVARDKRRGAWGACPKARLQPGQAWSTGGS